MNPNQKPQQPLMSLPKVKVISGNAREVQEELRIFLQEGHGKRNIQAIMQNACTEWFIFTRIMFTLIYQDVMIPSAPAAPAQNSQPTA